MRARFDAVSRAVIAALAVATIGLVPTPAGAQGDDPGDGTQEPSTEPSTQLSWGVRPASADGPDGRDAFVYELDPGESVDDYVSVINLSERPLTVAVYASDAFTTSDGGFDLLPANEAPDDVGSWVVTAGDDQVTIPARSRAEIPFRLTVPTNATPGDHAGGIVASLRSSTEAGDGSQLLVDDRVGARIYLRVTGELDPRVVLQDLQADYDGSANPLRAGMVNVTYVVANTGNVRVGGVPRISVRSPFGFVERAVDAPEILELLPGDEIAFSVAVDGVVPSVRPTVEVSFAPDTVGTFGSGDAEVPPVAESAKVWAVPWVWLGVLVLVIVGIRRRRRRKRRESEQVAAALEAARAEGRSEALAEQAVAGDLLTNVDADERAP